MTRQGKVILPAMALAGLMAAGSFSTATSQELSFTEGIGFETETAEPGALVLRELLSASEGRLSGDADISSAIGVAPGNYSALLDSAGLRFAYRFSDGETSGISLDSRLRYRLLVEDAWELRFGGTANGRWGSGVESKGFFGDWALGFEGLRTAIGGLPAALWEGNPLLRADLGWRFSRAWSVDAAAETFSDEDASDSFRTLFDFGSSLELSALSLRFRLVVKYSDFATPTGYIDGFDVRVAATIPIKGAEAE
jgi:hypothetical protein